jgi:hypothetical protein
MYIVICELQSPCLGGVEMFLDCSLHTVMYSFFEITGESPDSFLEIVRNVFAFQRRANHVRCILGRSRSWSSWDAILCSIIMLSALFNISLTTVNEEISSLIEPFHTFVSWPTINEWRQILRAWSKLSSAVGAIDVTSFEIHKPRMSPRNCTILVIDIIMLFMCRLSLIIWVSYNTLSVDSQDIIMMPYSMPFYPIFPEESYLSLMIVYCLPIWYIQIAILSLRHLQRNRYIDKIR